MMPATGGTRAGRGLDRRRERLAGSLRGIERVALAGAAARGRTPYTPSGDQPVDLALDQLELQLAVGAGTP